MCHNTSFTWSFLGSEAITIVILCLRGGAGLQQQLDHLDVAIPCRREQRRPA